MTEVNTVENAYELSLEMKTNGYAEDVISISESGYASSIENEAMLGISTDIEIVNSCNPENIVLKYTIKDEYLENTLGTYADCEEFQGIKRLNIFKYFEDINMLLPIETQFDEANNLIYAETDELGTYCVMDMEIWLDSLGVTPAEEIEEELNLSEVEFEFESPVILSDVSNGIYENYKYILQSDETISISKYVGEDTKLIIPSEINGYPVTSIGSGAFSNSDTLISVTIPDSVTSIGLAAFSSCDNLQEVSIPNSITSIPKRAFAWCYKLENISFSDSITIIDEFAFYFASISKLDIPNGVEYIGTHAFGSCKSLTEVTISESVLTIHDAAFDLCGNLESFTVDENNRKYISDDGVVYSRDKSELVFYPIAKADFSFTVPESVNIIRDRAFTYNKNIKTINLTKNIRYIMDSAFCLCPALENIYVVEENPYYQSINGVLFNKEYNAVVKYPEGRTDSEYFIPEGTLQIWKFSFAHCNNLVKLILPDGITCIKEYSFDRCLSLAEINLPDSITRIGFYAFCSCESLNNIVIPQGISQIEEKTFIGCDSLSSITIPENVKIINDPFYEKNENLTIYGYLGSCAEEYANTNNIKFVAIGNENTAPKGFLGTNWKSISLKGELNPTNGIDSDSDTITDWQEINSDFLIWNEDGSYEIPTLLDCIYKLDSDAQIESVLNAFAFRSFIPITTNAASLSSVAMGPSPLNLSVIVIKSDPALEDTDKDGYCDVDDPDAMNTPEFLDGEYDFLEGEIYSIFDYSNGKNEVCFDVEGGSTTTGTPIIMYEFNGNDNQKFRFKWHGNGYTIHPLNNENMSLTVNKSSYEVRLSPNSINPSDTELWEVIPYTLYSEGIIIRSKYTEISSTGPNTALYLSYSNDVLKVSNNRSLNIQLSLKNPDCQWPRFGEIYLDSLDIIPNILHQEEELENRQIYYSLKNYEHNTRIGLGLANKDTVTVPNTTLIIYQNGGNFPQLKFSEAKMNKVVCGVMATYNANDNIDFFRMAVEFENNALNISTGDLGSNPHKVDECLKAYNMDYEEKKTLVIFNGKNKCSEFEKLCSNGKSGIVCYRFNVLAMHFFAFQINNGYICFNRRSDDTSQVTATTVSKAIGSSSKTRRYFYVGYVLY